MRQGKNGKQYNETKKAVDLIVHTKCPTKWELIDNETGEVYCGKESSLDNNLHWEKQTKTTSKVTYCLFNVYDYKGGELSSDLDNKDLGQLMASVFENYDFKDYNNKELIKQDLLNIINSDEFYSNYAGGDGFCGEFYKVEDSKLTPISIEDNIDLITDYIFKNWN